VQAGARAGVGGGDRWPRGELLLGFEVHLGWLAAMLAGGASTATTIAVAGTSPPASLALRAIPLRAALGVPIPLFGGTLVPAAGASLDLLSFRADGLSEAQSGVRVEPAAEIGASYIRAGQRVFLRALLMGGLSLQPRDFDARRSPPVFRTPDGYLRAVFEIGFVLWKNTPAASL
jgi:hypothetical protein